MVFIVYSSQQEGFVPLNMFDRVTFSSIIVKQFESDIVKHGGKQYIWGK